MEIKHCVCGCPIELRNHSLGRKDPIMISLGSRREVVIRCPRCNRLLRPENLVKYVLGGPKDV